MADVSLCIDAGVLSRIHLHVTACYPEEGCGFLLGGFDGEVATVHDHLWVDNRRLGDGEAARRYLISPSDFRDAESDAANSGHQLVGIYHSHPDVAAAPSDYDLEHAWPSYRYLIVSVVRGRVHHQRVWQLEDDRTGFREHPLRVTTFSHRS